MTDDDDRPVCPGPHERDKAPATELLCPVCTANVANTLAAIPEIYVEAYLALEPGQLRADDTETGKRGKGAEAPLPLNADADALLRHILEVILSWYEAVIPAARLTWRPLPTDAVAITTACRILTAHLRTLIALPATPVTRWVNHPDIRKLDDDTIGVVRAGGDAIVLLEMTGVQAGLEIMALRRHAQRMLGHNRPSTQLDRPCPNPDCGEQELYMLEGADHVKCRACGEHWMAADYPRLAAVLGSAAQPSVAS